MSPNYQKATFLRSAADVKQLPPDQGIEIAIVGRSNAGKSSVLNRIVQSKSMARVSKTPGRTQHINIFVLDDQRRLIDLPGYGFAKAPIAAKEKWQRTIQAYVEQRQSLLGMILVMDIRHPLKPLDELLLEFCAHRQLAVHILLNKADKLSKGAAEKTRQMVVKALAEQEGVTVQIFSALRSEGVKELINILDKWYAQ
jgi:GTP-binding protein